MSKHTAKKKFYKFNGKTGYNISEYSSFYKNILKRAETEFDILKIFEIFIKKNINQISVLKLDLLEKFILSLLTKKKVKAIVSDELDVSSYSNEILHLLIKFLPKDLRLETLIYDFVNKYGTILKGISKYGYYPFNTLCWSSSELPVNIFNNVAKILHAIGHDIFSENKTNETCIESLNKSKISNQLNDEIFSSRYFTLLDLTNKQIASTFISSINALTKSDLYEEKYLHRILFCFLKNFNLCYQTFILRMIDLKEKNLINIKTKMITILEQINQINIKNIDPSSELYLFFANEKNENNDFTELINIFN